MGKLKYQSKFNPEWLKLDQFKSWLKIVKEDDTSAYYYGNHMGRIATRCLHPLDQGCGSVTFFHRFRFHNEKITASTSSNFKIKLNFIISLKKKSPKGGVIDPKSSQYIKKGFLFFLSEAEAGY